MLDIKYIIDNTGTVKKSLARKGFPSENIDRYNETYKLIYFQNSYALTGTQIIYTSLEISPNNPFVVGFETKYRCIYDTW